MATLKRTASQMIPACVRTELTVLNDTSFSFLLECGVANFVASGKQRCRKSFWNIAERTYGALMVNKF